jgi:ABC-type Fe3+/spermidine/putrescine transport system ATPase subunit
VRPQPLAGASAGEAVDLFVRPEQLRILPEGTPASLEGTVAAHVYQGGHVDIHVGVTTPAAVRLLVRSSEPDAVHRWPVGARVAVAIAGGDVSAFRAV